jgi:hypothetical protein
MVMADDERHPIERRELNPVICTIGSARVERDEIGGPILITASRRPRLHPALPEIPL